MSEKESPEKEAKFVVYEPCHLDLYRQAKCDNPPMDVKLDDLLMGKVPAEPMALNPADEQIFGTRLKSLVQEGEALPASTPLYVKTSHSTLTEACRKASTSGDFKGVYLQYDEWLVALEKIRHLLVDERDIHSPGKYIRVTWTPLLPKNVMSIVTITGAPYKVKEAGWSLAYPTEGYGGRYFHTDFHRSSLVFQHSPQVQEFCESLCIEPGYEDFCILHQRLTDRESAKEYFYEMQEAEIEKLLRKEKERNHY